MKRIMTVDLEPDGGYLGTKSCELIVPKILDYFAKNNITATFFTVSSLLDTHKELILQIAKNHEIASHTHTHQFLTNATVEDEIRKSKKAFAKVGIKVQGFRAPGFITPTNHVKLLQQHGYCYDASIASYFPGRYDNRQWLQKNTKDNQPFKYKPQHHEIELSKKTKSIDVLPMPTFLPTINAGLSYLKLFHPLSKSFKQPYMFYCHPWEFLKRQDLPPPRSITSKLLYRNCGKKAWNIFTNHIKKQKGQWVSCKQWLDQENNHR